MDAQLIPPAWREWWDERAALMEYEGGMSREAAEEAAVLALQTWLQEKAHALPRSDDHRV
jgi:hypothetical protein